MEALGNCPVCPPLNLALYRGSERLCAIQIDAVTHSLTYLLVYLLTAGSTSYECPTLLHLSARYGLEELSARLVDLPDARLALDVRDRRGRRPEDVAAQRRQLARRFRNFREMVRK